MASQPGGIAGFVWGLVQGYDSCPPATLCLNPEHHQGVSTGLAGGMIGGAGGALWGGVIGALVRREEWETIQDATPNRFVLSPVVDVRPGRDEGPTTYFGIRVQF